MINLGKVVSGIFNMIGQKASSGSSSAGSASPASSGDYLAQRQSALTAQRNSDSFSSPGVGASYGSFDPTGGVTVPPMPSAAGRNLKDPNVAAQYQEEMQMYTQLLQLKSQIQSMLHDTRKLIVQNMRA